MDDAKKEKIIKFTNKWIGKFSDECATIRDLAGKEMADDCFDIGFEMDCGNSFCEKYKIDLNKAPDILSKIDDIDLLGSAIFSNWRYYNHWAYSGEEIMKNREWFISMLTKLKELVQKNEGLKC